jgi:hypothetical protein
MKPFAARDDTTARARVMYARTIARLLREIDRPQWCIRTVGGIYRRDVAAACTNSLIEIRWVLLDDVATVQPEGMLRLRAFLTDEVSSPLHGDDPELARRVAHELAVAFVVSAHAIKSVPARRLQFARASLSSGE